MKKVLNQIYQLDDNALPGNYWFADFEVNNKDQKVYLWGLKNSKLDKLVFDTSLTSFWQFFNNIKTNCIFCHSRYRKHCKHKKHIIYFQNGSGYDLKFLLRELIRNGYYQKPYSKKSVLKVLTKNEWIEKHKQQKCNLIFDMVVDRGKIYMIHLKIDEIDLYFKCSKILFLPNTSLSKMGKLLNKTQSLYNFEKLDLDYDKYYFYPNKESVNEKVKEYLEQDVDILKFFMLEFNRVVNFQKWKLTLASTSYHFWKNLVSEDLAKISGLRYEKVQTKKSTNKNPHFYYKIGKNTYSLSRMFNKFVEKHFFKKNWIDRENPVIRPSYNGGLTHLNPDFVGKFLKNLTYIDINSSYAYIMQSHYLLPYGEPLIEKPDNPEYPCKIYQITPDLINENKKGIPFLPTTDTNKHRWYRKRITVENSWTITNYEYELFKKYYTGKYKVKLIYQFRGIPAFKLFGKYIGFWWEKKVKTVKDIEQYIAKIYGNALYGKFGQRNISNNYYVNHQKMHMDWDHLNPAECKLWEQEQVLTKTKYYLPIAIFITSLARKRIIDAVGYQYKNTIYCDTDSLVLNNKFNIKNIDIGGKIGEWKVELSDVSGIFRNKKNYILVGKDSKKCALASFKIDRNLLEPGNFIYGFTFLNQIQSKETKEGVKISSVVKELIPIWDKQHIRHPDTWFKTKEEYLKQVNVEKPKVSVFK